MTKNTLAHASANLYFNRLNEATEKLAELNNMLSEGVAFDDAFIDAYKQVDLSVQQSIDLTQTTLELCAQGIEHAKQQEQKWKNIRASFDRISKKQKERILQALENGASLLGSEKEYVLAQSPASVICAYNLSSKTFTNIIPDGSDVPPKFITTTTINTVNKKSIGEAIKNGELVPGFYLDTNNKHVKERDVK